MGMEGKTSGVEEQGRKMVEAGTSERRIAPWLLGINAPGEWRHRPIRQPGRTAPENKLQSST